MSSWIDRQKVSPLQIAITCVCGAAVMLDGFDAQIIGFVAPTLIQEFKIERAALATTFSAGLLGILVGCRTLAPLGVGRRWIIIVSVAIFAIATLRTARIETLQELTILRFITGIGLGACMPNALALTSEYAPARLRDTYGLDVHRFLARRLNRRATCGTIDSRMSGGDPCSSPAASCHSF